MIKNKFCFSALFLFFSFGQIFGISEELKNQVRDIEHEFFTPGPNQYMDTLGNLWREFESKFEGSYHTTKGNSVYLLVGFCGVKALSKIIFRCEDFQHVYYDHIYEKIRHIGYRYIFHSLRFPSLDKRLQRLAQKQDFASPQYSELIGTLDLLIARIETAGLINEANNFFEKLTILVAPEFLFVPLKHDILTAKENRLKFLQHLTFSLVLFNLVIERGLFNELSKSEKIELSSFINELINQAYPLNYEKEESA